MYCSQCKTETANIAPVNGICKDVSSDTALCKTNAGGKCTQCDGQSFMYQGGCYQTGNQNPGNTLCTAASAGKCTKAAEGHFVPPGADNTHQSVISCADETPVVLASNKQYKGIANCLKCTKPADGTPGTPMAATCDECAPGSFKNGAACTQCHSNCLTCSAEGESGCKSCKDG